MTDMMANEPLFVSSSTTIRVPPFARLCQSIHLLGKGRYHPSRRTQSFDPVRHRGADPAFAVLRHTNDRFLEPNFRFEEATLLSRTVQALSASVSGEMSEDSTGLSIPLAICFSALMTLYDPYSCPESSTGALLATELELQKQAIVGLKTVIKEVVDYSRHLQATLRFKSIENSSPFVTDCLYQAAASYVWLLRESGDPEQAQALNEIRTTLGMVDGKWRVAGMCFWSFSPSALPKDPTNPLNWTKGEYLRILDASEYYYSMEGN
ncbi:MAG: hypothetical protein M1829_003419 [Trizodia sp. TS-e1964]|nr:MAG: hypothetical protein M1829_003419 [Trizodia sp. TS-e1964]